MTIDELVETAQKYSCMIVTKDMWNTALGSVYKLQKIEQIVMNGDDTHYKLLMQIKEVLEDGK